MKKLIVLLLISFSAQSATGFFKGEEDSGMNKICYYESVNGRFSVTINSYNICSQTADDGEGAQTFSGATGFLKGERTSGMLKTCFYESHRGEFTKTMNSYDVCPPSAKQ